ncbi:MAG: diphthamide biosynthesis enzyme Dph2 [Desulfurococcales archaeon]|nr:diphthamide biosynthesis enzyme Dph2 [Desulfurococcales archaeon]
MAGSCPIPYRIDFSPLDGLEGLKGSKVVLQLPDGLKQYAVCISRYISESTGAEVYIDADSSFGSCDLHWPRLAHVLGADVIIHIGHTPYPGELASNNVEPPKGRPRIVYLAAKSKLEITRDMVEKSIQLLKGRGAKRLVLTATSQHTHLLKSLASSLEEYGFEAVIPPPIPPYFEPGQVIGCDYRLARGYEGDAYMIVSGGVFHALGLYLSTLKPVIQLDPYRGEALDKTPQFERIYAARLYKVSKAMDAKSWGIIVGSKTGQYRPWLVDSLIRLMKESGRSYLLYVSETLNDYVLRNIDTPSTEAWVVTSCPRLPIDDFHSYEKPVLTPGEARMALQGRLEPYIFPW